jgi:putative addiction module CopG family antidote
MGMNVDLTLQPEELVRAKVASRLYASNSEVVREALRLTDEQDRWVNHIDKQFRILATQPMQDRARYILAD